MPPIWLPGVIATFFATICYLSISGYYVPDTTDYLSNTTSIGQPRNLRIVPPAYPLTLDFLIRSFPQELRFPALVFIQQLSVVASILLLQALISKVVSAKTGRLVSIFIALNASLYFLAQTSQTESLYIFYITFALFCLGLGWHRYQERGQLALLLLSFAGGGFFCALATAQRTIGMVVYLTALLAFILSLRRGELKARASAILVFTLCYYATIFPFRQHNLSFHGDDALSHGTGLHIINRAGKAVDSLGTGEASEKLRRVLAKHDRGDWIDGYCGWHIFNVLNEQEKMDTPEADAMMLKASLDTLRENWKKALFSSIPILKKIMEAGSPDACILWTGLRPGAAQTHSLFTELHWDDLEYVNRHKNEFKPHQKKFFAGSAIYPCLELWSHLCRAFRGRWHLFVLAILTVYALFQRSFILLLLTGVASAQVFTAALTEIAQARYWEVSVPFYFAALLIVLLKKQAKKREKASLLLKGALIALAILPLTQCLLYLATVKRIDHLNTVINANNEARIGLAFKRYVAANNGDLPMPGKGKSWLPYLEPYLELAPGQNLENLLYHQHSAALNQANKTNSGKQYGLFGYNDLLAEGNGGKPWNINDIANRENLIVFGSKAWNQEYSDHGLSAVDAYPNDHRGVAANEWLKHDPSYGPKAGIRVLNAQFMSKHTYHFDKSMLIPKKEVISVTE